MATYQFRQRSRSDELLALVTMIDQCTSITRQCNSDNRSVGQLSSPLLALSCILKMSSSRQERPLEQPDCQMSILIKTYRFCRYSIENTSSPTQTCSPKLLTNEEMDYEYGARTKPIARFDRDDGYGIGASSALETSSPKIRLHAWTLLYLILPSLILFIAISSSTERDMCSRGQSYLSDDAVDVLVLLVELIAHSVAQCMQCLCTSVDNVQVVFNLAFHSLVFTIGFELVLGSVGQSGFVVCLAGIAHGSFLALVTCLCRPGICSCVVCTLSFYSVLLERNCIGSLLTLLGGERSVLVRARVSRPVASACSAMRRALRVEDISCCLMNLISDRVGRIVRWSYRRNHRACRYLRSCCRKRVLVRLVLMVSKLGRLPRPPTSISWFGAIGIGSGLSGRENNDERDAFSSATSFSFFPIPKGMIVLCCRKFPEHQRLCHSTENERVIFEVQTTDVRSLLQATATTEWLEFFLLYNEIPAFPCPNVSKRARCKIANIFQVSDYLYVKLKWIKEASQTSPKKPEHGEPLKQTRLCQGRGTFMSSTGPYLLHSSLTSSTISGQIAHDLAPRLSLCAPSPNSMPFKPVTASSVLVGSMYSKKANPRLAPDEVSLARMKDLSSPKVLVLCIWDILRDDTLCLLALICNSRNDVVLGTADLQTGRSSICRAIGRVIAHGDAIKGQSGCSIFRCLELAESKIVVGRDLGRHTRVHAPDNVEAVELEVEEIDDVVLGRGRRNAGLRAVFAPAFAGWFMKAWSLVGCDILVARRLDIPLSQATLALENGHDIGQVGSGLLGLSWRAGAALLVDGLLRGTIATSSTASSAVVEQIAATIGALSTTARIIATVSSSVRATVSSVPFATTSTSSSVSVFSLTLSVVAARRVCISLIFVSARAVSG
ncbi:hypothetical protein KCV07_g134, partial [Aureobasidium melanogenum]